MQFQCPSNLHRIQPLGGSVLCTDDSVVRCWRVVLLEKSEHDKLYRRRGDSVEYTSQDTRPNLPGLLYAVAECQGVLEVYCGLRLFPAVERFVHIFILVQQQFLFWCACLVTVIGDAAGEETAETVCGSTITHLCKAFVELLHRAAGRTLVTVQAVYKVRWWISKILKWIHYSSSMLDLSY